MGGRGGECGGERLGGRGSVEAGSARVHGGALFELLRGPTLGAVPRDRATPGSGFGVQATLARRTWEEVGSRGRDSGGAEKG